jgi:hypothetical protein
MLSAVGILATSCLHTQAELTCNLFSLLRKFVGEIIVIMVNITNESSLEMLSPEFSD